MEPRILQEIGLTEGEAKVYLALLRLGVTKTGQLAKEASVSLSKVYTILDRLIKKGLAANVLRGKVKHFTAIEPKRVLEYMEKRKKEIEEKTELVKRIMPELELEKKLSTKKAGAVVYDGFNAVTNFFRGIIDELKRGEAYYVIGGGYGNDIKGVRPFFHNHHTKRAKKGIKLKMLANYDIKDTIEPPTKLNAEIRFLPQYLITNMEVVFYKDKVFVVLWKKAPIGFLIGEEEALKSFKAYFDAFWTIAKT